MEKKYSCRHYFSGCVSVDDESSVNYYSFSEKGFQEIKTDGKVPLAFDKEKGLYAFKGMSEDGITVEIKNGKKVNIIDLEHETSSVLSGCFLDDDSFAMLQVDDENSLERTYIISISDKKYSEWTGYKLNEENTRDLFNRLLSLGAVLERPAGLQCYGQNIYIISHRMFSDMMNVVVYKLNRSEKSIQYVTGYHPISTTGKISVYFQEKNQTLYIYRGNKLTTVEGMNFPIDRVFDEPGEMLFYDDGINSGTYLYFIPDNKAPGESAIRKIHL